MALYNVNGVGCDTFDEALAAIRAVRDGARAETERQRQAEVAAAEAEAAAEAAAAAQEPAPDVG